MIGDLRAWTDLFQQNLMAAFPGRVAFFGLQGSRGRGEGKPDSDMDVVVVLDVLTPADIHRYRVMLETMPDRAQLCGFLSGWQELVHWEKSDLFQLIHDTTPILGSLDALAVTLTPADAARATRLGACNIAHGCTHTLCYGRNPETVKALYKRAVFTMQALHFCRTGIFLRSHAALRAAVVGGDAAILDTAQALRDGAAMDFEPMAERLLTWAQSVIREMAESV